MIVLRRHVAAWLRHRYMADWDPDDQIALHGAMHRGRGKVKMQMVDGNPVDGEFIPNDEEERCPLCPK